ICQRVISYPSFFISTIDFIAARLRRGRGFTHQHAPVATAVFTRMLLLYVDRAKRRSNTDVSQIQRRIEFMHYMVVIGKAHPFTVRAKDMHMAAAAQRSWRIRRGGSHGSEIAHLAAFSNDFLSIIDFI